MSLGTTIWLTWRQHRWQIVSVAAVALLASYSLIFTETGSAAIDSMPITGFYGLMVQLGFGGIIGMFWGAPLLARELEERTYFVAWGQDVTPVEWLRGKVAVLAVLAVLLGALIGAGDGYVGSRRVWSGFEANPFVQGGYALLGLSMGVLIGLLTRHVLTAIAGTLVFFALVRFLLAGVLRDYYLPPERIIVRWENTPVVPQHGLTLGSGFVGDDLEPVSVPDNCRLINENTCMRNTKAAIGTYVDYQPIDRMTYFQVFEVLLCLLLAAGFLFLSLWLLRRGGGWRPTRAHRKVGGAAAAGPVSIVAVSGAAVVVDGASGGAAEPEAGAVAVLVADPDAEIEWVPEPESESAEVPEEEPEVSAAPEVPEADQSAPATDADKADG
ncbi:hypothetical protein [Lentzea sp. NBRC 102530]|uniref:hypothetical protein n=1 Tax=Lentzea sp. NBRC 102530 TaxID=3032201 RepID=UPI0024A5D636|nr:hypothetical protein [Lentzea sp. NBRC 102530]GLY52884.1 hypothetical protein Lesp01_65400 [Lentzea sp. NBRC 102530]